MTLTIIFSVATCLTCSQDKTKQNHKDSTTTCLQILPAAPNSDSEHDWEDLCLQPKHQPNMHFKQPQLNQGWSEMTPNYRRIVKRHPKPNGVVGISILSHETFSQLDRITNHVATRLLCPLPLKKKTLLKTRRSNFWQSFITNLLVQHIGRSWRTQRKRTTHSGAL